MSNRGGQGEKGFRYSLLEGLRTDLPLRSAARETGNAAPLTNVSEMQRIHEKPGGREAKMELHFPFIFPVVFDFLTIMGFLLTF